MTLLAQTTLFAGSVLVRDAPLTVQTPPIAWGYAASIALDRPNGSEVVVEITVRVTQSPVAVSCTDATLQSLSGEITIPGDGVARDFQFFCDPAHGESLLIRTAGTGATAVVEVSSFRTRVLTPEEHASVAAVTPLRPVPGWSRYYGTSGESLVERKRVSDYLALDTPVKRPWIAGLTTVIYPRDQLSRALYVSGLYEPNTALVLQRLLTAGSTFIDVGAHAGVFTMLGSRFVGSTGRVVSFEPSERERARLAEHVRVNDLTNVTVVPKAVGGSSGRATLRVAVSEYGGLNTVGARFAYEGVETAAEMAVDLTTLDEFAATAGLQRVDAIKLDIEGAEYAALRGAAHVLASLRPALIIEVFSSALAAHGATAAQLERLLRESAYRLFRIDDHTAALHPLESIAEADEQNLVALPGGERPRDERYTA
jgi:FkbM family methyltransferase